MTRSKSSSDSFFCVSGFTTCSTAHGSVAWSVPACVGDSSMTELSQGALLAILLLTMGSGLLSRVSLEAI